jgi:hypothetical protein
MGREGIMDRWPVEMTGMTSMEGGAGRTWIAVPVVRCQRLLEVESPNKSMDSPAAVVFDGDGPLGLRQARGSMRVPPLTPRTRPRWLQRRGPYIHDQHQHIYHIMQYNRNTTWMYQRLQTIKAANNHDARQRRLAQNGMVRDTHVT